MKINQKNWKAFVKVSVFTFLFSVISNILLAQNCTVNANVDQTICATSPLTLLGSAGGLLTGGTLWTQVSGPSVTIATPTSLSTSVSGYTGGNTYKFRISATCQDGTLTYDDVNVIVNPPSIANAGPDFASCPGASIITLAASALLTGETGLWSVQGTNNGVTFVSPTSPTSKVTLGTGSAGNTTIRWTVTNPTGCTAFDEAVIRNYGGVAIVNAGVDKAPSNCYSTTQVSTMTASFGGNGTGGQGGLWTVINGPNIPTITSPTSNSTTVTNLITGTYTLRWTVSGPCVNGFDDVQIIVPAPVGANTAANAGAAQTYCDTRSNVTLTGNAPTYTNETGQWTFVSGPGTPVITSPNSRITTVTNVGLTGTYQFRWTITNTITGCTSNATVNIVFVAPVTAFSAGVDQSLSCNTTSASIPFTFTGGNQTQWRIISGPVNPNYASYPTPFLGIGNSPATISNLTTPGTYVIELRRLVSGSTNSCSILTDQVNITTSISPTASNAGSKQILACNVTSTALAGNAPAVGFGKWTQVSGPSTATISNNLNPTSPISGLIPGVYTFRWLISGGPNCATTQANASVVVSAALPTQANAGPDQSVCYGTPIILAGNTPQKQETGTWTVSPSSGIIISNINSPSTSVTGLAASTVYTFTWTITNACGTTTDNVLITSNATVGPTQSNAGPDQCQPSGTTSITLAGNNTSPETGLWTKITGGSATITNASLFNSTVTGLSNGIYKFEWALNLNGCVVSRDTMMVTISAPVTTANAGTDQNICGTTATFAGNTPVIGTGAWSQVTGSAGWTITNVNSPTSTITGLVDGVYTFRWTISNGSCTPSTDDVIINVSIEPTTANAGIDQSLCGSTSTTLAGNTPTNGSGFWTVVGAAPNTPTFSNITSPTSTISGLVQGTYNLRWTISSGRNCAASSDDVVITVVPTAVASANQTLCDVTSVLLTGLPAGSTGTWTQLSGPNTSVITSTGANTAAVTGMIAGSYVYTYTIPAIGCSTSATTTVKIDSPSTIADAGPDQDVCRTGANVTVTMAGNTITTGAGLWTRQSGPASPTIINPTSPNATIVFTTAGLYYYQWTSTNGTCSNADLVKITIYLPPSTANAGTDQAQVCGTVATMAGNSPTVGIGTWTQISGPNTATVTSPILNNTTMTGLIAGTYTFRWTITNGPCALSADDVNITVFTAPTQTNAGVDQTLCNVTTAILAGNTISVGTGLWSQFSGPNTAGITTPSLPTSGLTGLIPGVYVFTWTSTLAPCSSSDQVQITIYALPTTSNAGVDQSICLFDPVTLAANTPASGTGTWSQISGPSTVAFTSLNSATSSVTGVMVGTYVFQWTIVNGNCTSSTDQVQVVINALPDFANAGPDQTSAATCGLTTVTLAGNAPAAGTGAWSIVSGTGGTITTPSNRTSTFTGIAGNSYTLRWTISNGPCLSSDDMVVKFNQNPTIANAGPDQTGSATCGLTSVTLAANTPSIGTGAWSIVSGSGGTVTTPTSPVSTFTGTAGSTYTLRWTISNSPCTASIDDVIITFNRVSAITNMTATICSGSSFTATPANGTNGVVIAGTTYSWSAPAGAGFTGGAASSGSPTNISGNLTNTTNAAVTATYAVTPTSGSCIGSIFTVTLTINPLPAITAITSTLCSAGTFTVTPVNSTNGIVPSGTTYSWPAPAVSGGITGGTTGTNAANISGPLTNPTNTAQTATYTVTPKSGSCTGSTFTVTVTVNPKPAVTAMTATICSAETFIVSPVNSTNGLVPAGTTYTWAAPTGTGFTGGAASSGSPSSISGTLTNTTNAAVTATYTVTPTSGSCIGSPFTVTVIINPMPAVTAMTSTICSTGTFTLVPVNNTNGIVPSGSTYSWPAPAVTGGITGGTTGSGAASISGTLTNPTNSTQTATYTVTPTSGSCVGTTFTLTITIGPKPAVNNFTATICSAGTFTITPVNGTDGIVPAGTTYSWSAPAGNGFTGGIPSSGSPTSISGTLINTTNSAVTATYTVTPTSGNCAGSNFTVTVTVSPKPAINNLTATICSTGTFTITPVNGTDGIVPFGTTYSWLAPSVTGGITGGTSGSGATSIGGTLVNPTTSAQTAIYTITPVSGSCQGSIFTVTVTLNPTPGFSSCPSNITQSTAAGQCSAIISYAVSITGTPAPTVTYLFTGATTGSGSGTGSNSNFNKGVTTVTISAENVCLTVSCSFLVTINDTENPTITCPANIIQSTDLGVCNASVITPDPGTVDNCAVTALTWQMTGATTGSSAETGINNIGTYTFNTGVTTVDYTVIDATGNIGICRFTVTINDTENPEITCPAKVNAVANIGCNAAGVVLGTPVTSDNCSVSSVTNNHPSGTYPLGDTTITWTVTDASGNTSTCDQTVTVTNTGPTATADNYSVLENTVASPTSVNGNVVMNDTDPEGQTLTISSWGTPSGGGTLTTNTNGVFTFTPAVGFIGTSTFTYVLCDACGQCVSGLVTITVEACVAPPTIPGPIKVTK